MSDQSQGPGWWLASDGKWYPPETAPGPPPVPDASGAGDGGGLPQRAWRRYRGWPLWAQIAIGIVLLALILSPFTSSPDEEEASSSRDTTTTVADATTTTAEEPTTTTEPPTTTTAAPTTTTTAAPTTTVPAMTPSQEQAVNAARDYLDFSYFSRQGLIDQLSSEYGSQFPVADATFAVDYLSPDWNEQAAGAARDYLDFSSFSCQGLIDQLSSEYGSQFTPEQARYGAESTGIC